VLEYTIHTSEIEFLATQQGLSQCELTISAIAYDAEGKMLSSNVGKFDTPIRPDMYDAMKHDALHIRTWMDLPLRKVYLRVGMHDLTTDRMGAFEIPLDLAANNPASR
jgi:hypothetical protein